jgi:L-lactate dehydrogenase
MDTMKIGIVGIGRVGTACLLSVVLRGTASEIVVVNRTRERAEGAVTDLQYGASLTCPVKLIAGDFEDLDGASLVLVAAGINEKAGEATDRDDPAGRLKLLQQNAAVYREMIPKIAANAPDALILVVTDPPDPLADLARSLAGHDRVLSTGTLIDTLRFRFHLARHIGVHPASVEAQVLGEHGTSQVFVWSSAGVAGMPLQAVLGLGNHDMALFRQRIEQEVRFANITIIEGTGASQLGVGVVAARISEAILRDERGVMPVGAFNERYGVTFSLPTIVGRDGVLRILEPEMTQAEAAALEASADKLRQALASV